MNTAQPDHSKRRSDSPLTDISSGAGLSDSVSAIPLRDQTNIETISGSEVLSRRWSNLLRHARRDGESRSITIEKLASLEGTAKGTIRQTGYRFRDMGYVTMTGGWPNIVLTLTETAISLERNGAFGVFLGEMERSGTGALTNGGSVGKAAKSAENL